MKLQTITLALLSTVAIVEAKCYNGWKTQSWEVSKSRVEAHVAEMCKSDLSGWFEEGQTKYVCWDYDDGNCAQFGVTWLAKGKGGWTLAEQDCRNRLYDEIRGCDDVGGNTVKADWWVR